jgi:hypothetical protein
VPPSRSQLPPLRGPTAQAQGMGAFGGATARSATSQSIVMPQAS